MVMVKTRDGASMEDGEAGDSVDAMKNFTDGADGTIDAESVTEAEEKVDWLGIARKSYEDSTRFVDSSLRAQWDRNERAFQSRHPTGSKYLSDSYKHRSRLYRPKTRAMIRQGEAQLAASYFSNEDVISVTASNDADKMQQASAEVLKELLQHRLTSSSPKVGIGWFMTCVGAYQDAQKYGVVASKQWWEYKEERTLEEGEDGDLLSFTKVIKDKPHCDLIPVENIRFDRSAHWIDPVNTSPYVIIQHPMYIFEIEEFMKGGNEKTGEKPWKTLSRSELKAGGERNDWDSTRSQRENNREDSQESQSAVDDFAVIWVHENFVEWDGKDHVYFTCGTSHMLSDPVPVHEIYKHASDGERPVVLGYCILEAHKTYPSGKPELTEQLQAEANDVANLRLDNVKLAMQKRFLVKRGRQVDLKSLIRAAPGTITMVGDTEGDVKEMDTRDVTSSAYAEQDRINADFDDLSGSFSGGSVQTNRAMNETVGGMNLIAGSSNLVGELDLRVFTETWAEPVIRQIVNMERHYETDTTIIALAAEKAQLFMRYGMNTVTDEMLTQDLTVRVNVGIGATDPMQRLQKFKMGAEIVGEIFGPSILKRVNQEEVVKEIFGALGYRDGKRFFKFGPVDPAIEMLQEQLQEMQKQLESKQMDNDTKIEVARLGAMSRVLQQYVENQGDQQNISAEAASKAELEGMRSRSSERINRERGRQGELSDLRRQRSQKDSDTAKGRQAFLTEVLRGENAARVARERPTAANAAE